MRNWNLEIVERLRNGDLELLDFYAQLLGDLKRIQSDLSPFVDGSLSQEDIFQELESLLKRFPETSSRPALFGLPIGVKDIFRVESFETRCGSKLPPKEFEGPEASCVSVLKEAGAIVVGKTVTTEFAARSPGATKNPFNSEHTPGGSSSGSGTVIGSGALPIALGSQTSGSVLRPAAYCNAFGFKPSFNRIHFDNIFPLSPSLDHVGVLAASPYFLELVLPLLLSDWSLTESTSDSLSFVVPKGPFLEKTEVGIRRSFEKAIDVLSVAGFEITTEPFLEDIDEVVDRHYRLSKFEASLVHQELFKKYQRLYSEELASNLRQIEPIIEDEHQLLKDSRLELRSRIGTLLSSGAARFLLCPSTCDFPPRGLSKTGSATMNLPFTNAGVPAATCPLPIPSEIGLPVGLQIVCGFGKDESLLHCVKQIANVLSPES